MCVPALSLQVCPPGLCSQKPTTTALLVWNDEPKPQPILGRKPQLWESLAKAMRHTSSSSLYTHSLPNSCSFCTHPQSNNSSSWKSLSQARRPTPSPACGRRRGRPSLAIPPPPECRLTRRRREHPGTRRHPVGPATPPLAARGTRRRSDLSWDGLDLLDVGMHGAGGPCGGHSWRCLHEPALPGIATQRVGPCGRVLHSFISHPTLPLPCPTACSRPTLGSRQLAVLVAPVPTRARLDTRR